MIKYFAEENFSHISEETIIEAGNVVKGRTLGAEEFIDRAVDKLLHFSTKIFHKKTPKAVLYYGPPGTGKSYLTEMLIREMGFTMVTAPMAAGDLKKGIVGDSEKCWNAIADRARAIPWEICCVLIDELEQIALDRKSDEGAKGSDLLGVLLATMDGAKNTPNLKMIGSTNLRENIDSAFLRRLEVQCFLGNPPRASRKRWI